MFVMSGVAIQMAELTHLPKITFQIQIKSHFSQLLVFCYKPEFHDAFCTEAALPYSPGLVMYYLKVLC